MERPNPVVAVANQSSYRVPDAQIAICVEHGGAAVLCVTAGKVGRKGRKAAFGATLFWVTCPNLNNIIARLERHGAVGAVQSLINNDCDVSEAHVASHLHYEKRAKELLDPERWKLFDAHFGAGAVDSPRGRKYGNAAVSHATDIKCLHALVAQSLCGAPNPIGDAVLRYVLVMAERVRLFKSSQRTCCAHEDNCERIACSGMDDRNDKLILEEDMLMDSTSLAEFVRRFVLEKENHVCDSSGEVNADSFCSAALEVVTFLDGRPPKARKKYRIN
uniref:Uncharacterized protein n=1 Tax=Trypanosoma congolense (strain IL3000) TaxID=1068625 RepID=G0UKS5_TRYCI|nr:conserved hypothetical protein [Trypanosoma congolense IL3000]